MQKPVGLGTLITDYTNNKNNLKHRGPKFRVYGEKHCLQWQAIKPGKFGRPISPIGEA